jgi:hypothetical protein
VILHANSLHGAICLIHYRTRSHEQRLIVFCLQGRSDVLCSLRNGGCYFSVLRIISLIMCIILTTPWSRCARKVPMQLYHRPPSRLVQVIHNESNAEHSSLVSKNNNNTPNDPAARCTNFSQGFLRNVASDAIASFLRFLAPTPRATRHSSSQLIRPPSCRTSGAARPRAQRLRSRLRRWRPRRGNRRPPSPPPGPSQHQRTRERCAAAPAAAARRRGAHRA